MIVLVVCAVLLGLAIGSFLNVVAWRLPRGESLAHPPSHCPRCGAFIRTRHNIPVLGWLILRGGCYDCGEQISVQYPLIEALTGIAFGVVAGRVGAHPELAAYLFAVAVLIVGGLWCLAGQDVVRSVSVLTWLGGLAFTIGSGLSRSSWQAPARALTAAGIVLACGLALALAVTRNIRVGQALFLGAIGLYVGMRSWRAVGLWPAAAFVLVLGLLLLLSRTRARVRLRTPIALGGVVAALVALLAG